MTRKEAVKYIMFNMVQEDDLIVASTGMTSREVYAVRDRSLNFYMQGSMGNALAIGIGMALNTSRKVVVIDGDGSALMGLGAFVTHNKLKPSNLIHVILDNNEHASTGGQQTSSDAINFEKLAPNTVCIKIESGKGDAGRIPLTGAQIAERFMRAYNG